MNITILRIIKTLAEKSLVEFSSPYGIGFSSFIAPAIEKNQSYDVEMDIDDEFYWNKNISPSNKNTPSIRYEAEITYITAEITSIAEDGCAALKLGSTVILISLENENKNINLPSFIEISANEITLYPTNI